MVQFKLHSVIILQAKISRDTTLDKDFLEISLQVDRMSEIQVKGLPRQIFTVFRYQSIKIT